MTTQRKKWIAATVAMIALVGCFIIFSGAKEPRFEGRSLAYWASRLNLPEAQRALTAIGTNALPFLIEWLDEEPNRVGAWMWKVGQRLPDSLRPNPWPLGSRRDIAGNALGFLGTNAIPAIPELIRTFDWNWSGGSPPHGQYALAEIGPAAIPALMRALEEDTERVDCVVGTLVYMSIPDWQGPRTTHDLQQIVAALDQLASHSNDKVRLAVAHQLLLFDHEAIRNLVDGLWVKLLRDPAPIVRVASVERAEEFAPDSPQLAFVELLRDDPDAKVRAAVERALKQVGRLPPLSQSDSTTEKP